MTDTAAHLLKASGLPLLEARALLSHVVGVSREGLVAHPELAVSRGDANAFEALVQRRAAGEPLAYLLGEKEFYGRFYAMSADVLVPRPETELLVDLALERLSALRQPRVLDLGTGSGCIAVTLALECPAAQVSATDASAAALAIARRNGERLGARVTWSQGDWYSALPAGTRYDVIVSNPPYVAPGDPHLAALRFEPAEALVAGHDGLACLEQIVAGAAARLAPAGWLVVEHGYDQAAAMGALFALQGLSAETRTDHGGQPRVTLGRRRQAPV